jgi:hypothetical protein
MTTPGNLALLRLHIAEFDSAEPWTDDVLSEVLTRLSDNMNLAASELWSMKAARYSSLVSVTEAGASRDLNKLFDHAAAMAKMYATRAADEAGAVTGSPFTVQIERV